MVKGSRVLSVTGVASDTPMVHPNSSLHLMLNGLWTLRQLQGPNQQRNADKAPLPDNLIKHTDVCAHTHVANTHTHTPL